MTEWRLPGGETAAPDRPWMRLERQPGFTQRAALVTGLARLVLHLKPYTATVTDLGCGDGAMLAMLPLGVRKWGYELGEGDVLQGHRRGLDIRQKNIVTDALEYGDVLIASEVLEHPATPSPSCGHCRTGSSSPRRRPRRRAPGTTRSTRGRGTSRGSGTC